MKNFTKKFAQFIAAIALFIGISSVNTPSALIYFQPKVPKSLEKYRK